MSRKQKLLDKLLSGNADGNFPFDELVAVLVNSGWSHSRTSGSHAAFRKAGAPIVTLQRRKDGKAKGYQVEQVRKLLTETGGTKK